MSLKRNRMDAIKERLMILIHKLPGTYYPSIYSSGGVISNENQNSSCEIDPDEQWLIDVEGGFLVAESMSKAAVEFLIRAHNEIPILIKEMERLESRLNRYEGLMLPRERAKDD